MIVMVQEGHVVIAAMEQVKIFCSGSGYSDNGFSCIFCDGTGKDNCFSCNGKGYKSCNECDGTGEIICEDCNGYGKLRCGECNGEGKVTKEYPDCEGSGRKFF